MVLVSNYVYATSTFELEFKTFNNKKQEKFDLYLLLPKDYIIFAIKEANLELDYEGVNTLKRNIIPGITVEKEKIQNEVYIENEIEYIQIKLDNQNDIYTFEILENYPKMDIKYRIKNVEKDYIVHIDNFKIEKGKCEIEYDYAKDTIKQPDRKVMPFGIRVLIILLVIVLIVAVIARIKGRR